MAKSKKPDPKPYQLEDGEIEVQSTKDHEIAIRLNDYDIRLRIGRNDKTYHKDWAAVLKEINFRVRVREFNEDAFTELIANEQKAIKITTALGKKIESELDNLYKPALWKQCETCTVVRDRFKKPSAGFKTESNSEPDIKRYPRK